MNRRSFLTLGAATAALYALDPERLLWVPGAKTIVLPPDKTLVAAQEDEVACLLAGVGGPYVLTGWVGSRQRPPTFGMPSSPERLVQRLGDQEYRLLVERGRKILEHRKTVVAPTPEVIAHISREDATRRWKDTGAQVSLGDRPWNPDWDAEWDAPERGRG